MKRFECPKCHKKVTASDRRQHSTYYCQDCYDATWAAIVNKLMGEHGLAPMFEIKTDECPDCEGQGSIEQYGGSHSWSEKCETCKGTGKEK